MCGIFGFSGNKKPNIAKMKILGLYNTKRGKDSCGYFYNNSIFKGAEPRIKEFPDFIQNHIIQDTGKPKSNVFIGHTRQASVGGTGVENCHPFNINHKYIIAHNGTIDNIWELCEKYNVPTEDISVDSKALGILFHKIGPKILTEYRGYAALLIHDLEDVESLYVYHGASRQYDWINSPVVEERPLFGMLTREGYYFSSLEESLLAIRDVEGQQPFAVQTNKLIKVSLSNYGAEVIDIEREYNNVGIFQKKTYPTTTVTKVVTNNLADLKNKAVSACNIKVPNYVADDSLDIESETLPIRNFLLEEMGVVEYVVYWKGRYYDENHNLMEGKVFLDANGCIFKQAGPEIYEHYFYAGVLLDGKVAYEKILSSIGEQNVLGLQLTLAANNFAKNISHYAKYPVTNTGDEAEDIHNDLVRKAWYKNGQLAAGGFTPMFGDRDYTFKIGELVKVSNNKGYTKDIYFVKTGVTTIYANMELDGDYKKKVESPESTSVKEPNVTAHFNDGVIVHINKDLSFLKAFFKRKYTSVSEIENSIPYTVYLAIVIYLREVLEDCCSINAQKDIDRLYSQFLETAINDKSCFYDLIDTYGGFKSIDEYLELALKQEAKEDVEEASASIITDLPFEEMSELNEAAYRQSLRDMQAEKLNDEMHEIDNAYTKEINSKYGKSL